MGRSAMGCSASWGAQMAHKTTWGTSMETRHNQQAPDSVAEQRASNELIRLIRKLRWIGME